MSDVRVLAFQQKNKKGKPNDDYYCWRLNGKSFAVADGVSRTQDPGAVHPATSRLAAAAFCTEVTRALEQDKTFEQAFICASITIANLNKAKDITVQSVDYLARDYMCCVGVAGILGREIPDRFFYGYLPDCGLFVYDRNYLPVFVSENPIAILEEFRENRSFSTADEKRVWWRRDMRNRPGARVMTYGALTGEPAALSYVKTGYIDLQPKDVVILFSDGMYPFLFDHEFQKLVAYLLSCPFGQEGKQQAIAGYLGLAEKDLRAQHVDNLDDDRTMIAFAI